MNNEYFYTSFFLTKCMFDHDSLATSLRAEGWFSQRNINNTVFLAENKTAEVTQSIKDVTKNRTMADIKDGSSNLKFRHYKFIAKIHTPITMQNLPLPMGCPVKLNFKRSDPKYPLLKITDEVDAVYDYNNIEITNCKLEVPFIRSALFDKKYGLISNSNPAVYKIDDYAIRTQTISEGLSEVQFSLTTGGELPRFVVGGLLPPSAFNGDFSISATNFHRNGLVKYEILVDEQILPGTPVTFQKDLCTHPYVQFLKCTNWWQNNLSGKLLSLDEFENSNFLITYDFTDIDEETGWLSYRFHFEQPTSEKLIFVTLLVFPKTMTINKDGNVSIS